MASQPKTNAMRILEQKQIAHDCFFYDCKEFTDAVQIADMLGQSAAQTFKTLMTQGKSGSYFAFVIPAPETLDLKKAAAAVNEKSLALLPVKDIQKVTGYIRGGCTAIGMKKDYPVVLDAHAAAFDTIIVSGGKLGTQIHLSPDGFLQATNGRMAAVTIE